MISNTNLKLPIKTLQKNIITPQAHDISAVNAQHDVGSHAV